MSGATLVTLGATPLSDPMARLQPARLLALALLGWAGSSLGAGAMAADMSSPGAKGAQVYCYMRSSGNSHDVSWTAAYALIKRQSAGMFRTSPEHAAVMITEAVVQNPGSFPDCGRFLGDLFSPAAPMTDLTPSSSPSTGSNGRYNSGPSSVGGMTRDERYGS